MLRRTLSVLSFYEKVYFRYQAVSMENFEGQSKRFGVEQINKRLNAEHGFSFFMFLLNSGFYVDSNFFFLIKVKNRNRNFPRNEI